MFACRAAPPCSTSTTARGVRGELTAIKRAAAKVPTAHRAGAHSNVANIWVTAVSNRPMVASSPGTAGLGESSERRGDGHALLVGLHDARVDVGPAAHGGGVAEVVGHFAHYARDRAFACGGGGRRLGGDRKTHGREHGRVPGAEVLGPHPQSASVGSRRATARLRGVGNRSPLRLSISGAERNLVRRTGRRRVRPGRRRPPQLRAGPDTSSMRAPRLGLAPGAPRAWPCRAVDVPGAPDSHVRVLRAAVAERGRLRTCPRGVRARAPRLAGPRRLPWRSWHRERPYCGVRCRLG